MEEWKMGIFREVVKSDGYGLRKLDFVPDVIYDIGANVGIFAIMARILFPRASIVAIEPNEKNYQALVKLQEVFLIDGIVQAALGSGKIYHEKGAALNGSHETYLSASIGFPESLLESNSTLKPVEVCSMSLQKIMQLEKTEGKKVLLKCDCEGAENTILTSDVQFEILKQIDYIAMEIHRFALTTEEKVKADELINKRMEELSITHNIQWEHYTFLARKK